MWTNKINYLALSVYKLVNIVDNIQQLICEYVRSHVAVIKALSNDSTTN